jgi:hypothetical protein
MRHALPLSLLLTLLAGPAFAAEVAVKPLSPEARAAAREKVLRVVDAQGPGSLAGLWADAVTCGPRLWAAIGPELGAGADADVAPIYLLVDKGLASRAGLQTVDAAKVPADQKQNVVWLTEGGAKLGQVVVQGGIVRHRSTPKLGELVAARFLKPGKAAVRDLDAAELPYFRGLVPNHLNEPAFSVTSGERMLLIDFDADLKAVWIDWAPAAAGGK